MGIISHDKQMRAAFKHIETTDHTLKATGVVLKDEPGEATGIYEQTEKGLRPVRLILKSSPRYDEIIAAWTKPYSDASDS